MVKIKSVSDIRITCKSDDYLPFQSIQDFQGNLKIRSQKDIDHLITSILTFGFSFPFFIWRQSDGTCSCLDGHGRIQALLKLEKDGYDIPELPVVYIDADSESEARTKLIEINTVNGKYNEDGFCELIKDIPELSLKDYTFPELDLTKLDIELKILKTGEHSIQTMNESNWSDIFVTDQDNTKKSDLTKPSVNKKKVVDSNVSLSTSTSPTVNKNDESSNDSYVFCPNCGGSFEYKKV